MHPAALDESKLLSDCAVRRQRRSGPGGQHRNKVETAVVITHQPTGVQGEASERRSQEENRRRAIYRLRVNLALGVREPVEGGSFRPSDLWQRRCHAGRLVVSVAHVEFPALLAEALDVLSACDMDASEAAERLSCTASQLIKLLQKDPRALAQVNRHRQLTSRPPYR